MDNNQLINLMYEGASRFRSLKAEYRDWAKSGARAGGPIVFELDHNVPSGITMSGGGLFPTTSVATRRVWFENPVRLRVEVTPDRQRAPSIVGVRDRAEWWLWSKEAGERAGQEESLPPMLNPIALAPHLLLGGLWLEIDGEGERCGRNVIRARGVARTGKVAAGLTTLALELDEQYGTILRRATLVDGVPVSTSEVVDIAYDVELGAKAFHLTPQRYGGVPLEAKVAQSGCPNDKGVEPISTTPRLAGTIWLRGFSKSGKTTIAAEIERLLAQLCLACCVLDDAVLRAGVSNDLGVDRQSEREHARRTVEMALLLARSGIIPVVALNSLEEADLLAARGAHDDQGVGFLEVFVYAPSAARAARNARGLGSSVLHGDSNFVDDVGPKMSADKSVMAVAGHGVHPRLVASRIVEAVLDRSQRDVEKPRRSEQAARV